jgi:hypothetical protein
VGGAAPRGRGGRGRGRGRGAAGAPRAQQGRPARAGAGRDVRAAVRGRRAARGHLQRTTGIDLRPAPAGPRTEMPLP